MKLNIQTPNSKSNHAPENLKRAKISDIKVIVDLLRRHYAHPIRTLVQEYLCNARDAHREIKQERSIEVSLPTKSHPVFKIRDYGPGMDSTRLEENFLSYGNSTKNKDNTQTGGFGIGSKSAWVYTPTFYIKQIQGKVETMYEASIAVHYEGALNEISKKNTNADNGVEIQIPVQIKDIEEFTRAFYRATYFWTEPVTVLNLAEDELSEVWVAKEYINSSHMIFCGESNEAMFLEEIGIDDLSSVVVVDGIIYDTSYSLYSRNTGLGIIPKFNTGTLSVSISREMIEDVPQNRELMAQHLKYLPQAKKEAFDQLLCKLTPSSPLKFDDAINHIYEKQKKYQSYFQNLFLVYFDPLMNTVKMYNENTDQAVMYNQKVYIGFNISQLKFVTFYTNRNKNFSLSTGKYLGRHVKFLINDSKENNSVLESILKYRAKQVDFKDYDTVVVIQNNTLDSVIPLVNYLNPGKISSLPVLGLGTLKPSTAGSRSKNFMPAVPVIVEKRTIFNCAKKIFDGRYSRDLKKVINSSEMFTESQYLILSWEDQEMIEKIKDHNQLFMEKLPVYFVAAKDLCLFDNKKFFKKENYQEMKIYADLKADLAKVAVFKKEHVTKEYKHMLEVVSRLKYFSALNYDAFGHDYDFQKANTRVKRLLTEFNVVPDKKFANQMTKVMKNKYAKYILSYIADYYPNDKEIKKVKADLGL